MVKIPVTVRRRHAVKSSMVKAIGYDPFSGTLEVEFSNGTVYQYAGVKTGLFAELMTAESIGQYFGDKVKKGGYEYTKLDLKKGEE